MFNTVTPDATSEGSPRMMIIIFLVTIRFNQLGSGVGGVLINDKRGRSAGVVYVPGALQEKLEPMQAFTVSYPGLILDRVP